MPLHDRAEILSVGTTLVYFLFHQMTPLHMAAGQGCVETVKCIVDKGADINIQDYNGVMLVNLLILLI